MTYLYDLFVRIAERHEEATLWEKARPTGRKSHHAHDGTMNRHAGGLFKLNHMWRGPTCLDSHRDFLP